MAKACAASMAHERDLRALQTKIAALNGRSNVARTITEKDRIGKEIIGLKAARAEILVDFDAHKKVCPNH
jgi:hypothetical protein